MSIVGFYITLNLSGVHISARLYCTGNMLLKFQQLLIETLRQGLPLICNISYLCTVWSLTFGI